MSFLIPEPSRHDLNFKLRGIPIRVTPWFWLAQCGIGIWFALPLQVLGIHMDRLVLARIGLLTFVAWVLSAFVSILVHEFGHVVVGAWFGARGEIVLTALGGLALGSAELSRRSHRIAVYAAGPAAQLLLAGAVWIVSRLFDPYPGDFGGGPRMGIVLVLHSLLWINMVWPLFNLIPVPPLDGGQVLLEVIQWRRFGDPPPWEQGADWWKHGTSTSDWRNTAEDERSSHVRRLFPWVVAGTIGVFLVWWAYDANRHRRQHEAFAKLERVGAVFGWDGKDTFYGVSFRGRDLGDEELALLEVFNDDHFDSVDASRTQVTDAGLRHLSGLKSLELLDLHDTQIGDEGLRHLAGLKRLKMLHLSGTQVTDAGLVHLVGMQNLEWLSLSCTAVTDAGIIHLKRLSRLEGLHIYETGVTADGIGELSQAFPTLKINPKGEHADR